MPRGDLVKRMADARLARQKVLEGRKPMRSLRPATLTEADLIRRSKEHTLANLDAAITRAQAPAVEERFSPLEDVSSDAALGLQPRGWRYWAVNVLAALAIAAVITSGVLVFLS